MTNTDKASLIIRQGDMRLAINPELGGSITFLKWQDHDIMRAASSSTTDVTETACFPLVPIVNRIPDGQFNFEGQEVDLAGNFLGLPDFIHGLGWRGTWSVASAESNSAELLFEYPTGGEWPWPFEARQNFNLTEKSLRVELSVKNLSHKNMPADLGLHPYFPTTSKTRLFADYDGHWINNEWGHALKRIQGSYRQDFTEGAGLDDTQMTDQTHYGWKGMAKLIEPGRPDIRITADDKCTNLHIFFPPNGDYVAIEPTVGRGNPFGVLPREYRVLEPGKKVSIWMNISVEQPSS